MSESEIRAQYHEAFARALSIETQVLREALERLRVENAAMRDIVEAVAHIKHRTVIEYHDDTSHVTSYRFTLESPTDLRVKARAILEDQQ